MFREQMFHENVKKQLNWPLESPVKQHYKSEIPITQIPGNLMHKKRKTPIAKGIGFQANLIKDGTIKRNFESRCIII